MAATTLAEPRKAIHYAMVGFDSRASSDDPVLDEVAGAVAANWATYLSAFSDRPTTVFRAVLLDALRQAQEADVKVAAAVALVARNVLPYLDLGQEREISAGLVARSEELISAAAAKEWSTAVDSQVAVKLPAPTKPGKLDRKALLTKVEAAAGPSNEKGEALPTPNPHWTNQAQAWSFGFSPRMVVAIADSVDAMSEALVTARASTDQALLGAMQSFVGDHLPGLVRSGKALERRLNLLWWRQSLYSIAAKQGYRSMKPTAAAVQMAADVFALAPAFSPMSVEFFLREAVAEVVGNGKGKGAGSATFKQIASEAASIRKETSVWWPDSGQSRGRRPFVAFLAADKTQAAQVADALGIDADAKLSLPDFAVWVLRELQAYQIAGKAAS